MQVKKISELDQAVELYNGCCFPIVQNDTTKRVTFQTMREEMANSSELAAKLATKVSVEDGKGLSTNDFTDAEKTKLASIEMYKEVSGTISVGGTSITLSNAAITTTSTIDIYTDKWGVNPESVVVSNGSVTITFEAQETALGVKVRVS